MVQAIVWKEICGSVRSSVSALARLLTVESEAAETRILPLSDEMTRARRLKFQQPVIM
jgi:hypothetical protein